MGHSSKEPIETCGIGKKPQTGVPTSPYTTGGSRCLEISLDQGQVNVECRSFEIHPCTVQACSVTILVRRNTALVHAVQAVNQKTGNKAMAKNNLELNREKPRCWGYHGTKPKTPSLSHSERQSRTSAKGLRGAFQSKFKSHAVWQALRKLLKRSIYTRSETPVGPERQLPCMQWSIKLPVSTKDYLPQNHA